MTVHVITPAPSPLTVISGDQTVFIGGDVPTMLIATEEGVAGRDGIDGQPGRDGIDGVDGQPGRDGRDGIDGSPGIDGKPGADGRDGIDGLDGRPGTDGRNGTDGAPGRDGKDGKDATRRKPALWPSPQEHQLTSPWKRHGNGSGGAAQTGQALWAVPIDCPGLDIVGVGVTVQGGVSTTNPPFINLGVYDSKEDGTPGSFLISVGFSPTGGNNWHLTFPSVVPAAAHRDRVWLAYVLNGDTQMAWSENTGVAGIEFPSFGGSMLNHSASVGDIIQSINPMGGNVKSINPVWPAEFGMWGIVLNNPFPNMALRVRKPAT